MAEDLSSAEALAREVVARFEDALDRQFDAAEARSWTHAPKHIREAHGDPSTPDPPSQDAMHAWTAWLELRMNSRRRCQENLEKGRDAVRADPARAEIYWKRAISTAENALAELDDHPDGVEPEAVEHEDLPDDLIAGYLALLEEYRGRLVANDAVLPAPAARLRAALERRYQRSPDPGLAEALIALPVFVPPEDAVAVERHLMRRTGEGAPIGRLTWDRGLTVVQRIAGQQRVAMRQTLGAAPGRSGVASIVPVLGGVTASSKAAAAQAMSTSPNSDVGDIFAGCFLSLAGSLVGSVIGTVAVVLRTLPEVAIGELVLRFVVGFVVGVVVGAIASFAAAPPATGIGGSQAENIWVGAVAIAAAAGAAVTAWLLFTV